MDTITCVRCSYCGCVLQYTPRKGTESLATSEQKEAIFKVAREQKNWAGVSAQLAAFGTTPVWGMGSRCQGCGASGTHFVPRYLCVEKAEVAAAEQNKHLETSEAQHQIAHWEEEVDRRTDLESLRFAKLFCDRFPQWANYGLVESQEGLRITIPSENPAISMPLKIHVTNGEVLVRWMESWHFHVHRRDDERPGCTMFLNRALEDIADVVEERLIPFISQKSGRTIGGGRLLPDKDLEHWGTIEQIQLHSWRGTYDRVVLRPNSEPEV